MAHYDSHQTIQKFFNETSRISKLLVTGEVHIEPSPLLSILRPYQLETAKWMIMRELKSGSIELGDWQVDIPSGGILADEMGLGKTVEMLACILGNPKVKKNDSTANVVTNSSAPPVECKKEVIDESASISSIECKKEIIDESASISLAECKEEIIDESDVSLRLNSSMSSIDESDISLQINSPELVVKQENISNVTNSSDLSPLPSDSLLGNTSSSSSVPKSKNRTPQKRKLVEKGNPPVLEKRPALSAIKINRTMKKKMKELLKEYFDKFKRYCRIKKSLEENAIPLLDINFKVVLLNRFYNVFKDHYSRQQTWGFLLTEYNVDDTESVGYSILEREMRKKVSKKKESTDDISDQDVTKITTFIDEFLTEKIMQKFEKDFKNILAYSLHVDGGDYTVVFDGDDVACKCGSDKAQGKKIMCSKCNKFQHLLCVGLDHTFKDFDNYICPYCWIKLDLIESSATLIVIPSTLSLQWKQEIKKHASDNDLKVRIYEGVNKDYTLPNELATFDIVIVSFETLRAELNYASEVVDKNTRSFRHHKRYFIFGSPLTCIHWWRLCIDEAQMVESANHVSQMVSHLKSTHRWAISGTPVGNSLKDLHGLTTFLGVVPFCDSYQYFNFLLQGDQSLLHILFAHLMRRNTKSEVAEQLNIPKLETEINWLSFTPVEGYFYQYTHSVAEEKFMQKIRKIQDLDQRLSKACRRTAESVLAPLVTLRQACVHFQAVNKENFNLSKTTTMEKLLEELIKKTKIECEDILRLYIMNIHGAAGIRIEMGQFPEAVSLYKMVLSRIKEFDHVTPDVFQVLHAMHNLYETAAKDDTITLTPEEQKIPEQIEELEQKYIERRREPVTVLLQNVEKHSNEIENYLKDFRLASFEWWTKIFNSLDFDEMRTRIVTELDKMNLTLDNIRVLLSTSHRLGAALEYWLTEMEDKRTLTYTFLEKITKNTPVSTLCESAVECHLRQTAAKKACLLCKMESVMMTYENILFNGKMKKKQDVDDENSNPLNWNMSAYECILNAILNNARAMFSNNAQITRASDHLKVLNLLKREFKTIRATWTKQCDLVHSYDEVEMAKSRFDAVCGSTDKLDYQNPLCQNQYDTYEAASIVAYSRLQSKLGSLHYLKNLEKNHAENVASECCPVCQLSSDERRGVMSCGHFTCCVCMITLIKHSTGNEINCPICRNSVHINNITYVFGGGVSGNAGDIKGNYSVKIVSITSKVLSLKKNDPETKILIFSTWDKVLDVIEDAFKENGIKFQRFIKGKRQKTCMKMFQENKEVTALLIRLHSGGKGLNLTEASHIIFTEPVLSIADEKQAIGRIDRLGQTKNMVIHKFILRSTIEQHLLKMNEGIQQNDTEVSELTFRDLKELFIASANDIENDQS